MVDKPKKPMDWAKTSAVAFIIGVLALIFLNKYVAGFPLGVKTALFVIIAGIVLFIALKILKFATPTEQFTFEDVALYGGVLAGLIYVVMKFNIAPEFSIVVRNLASIVGM